MVGTWRKKNPQSRRSTGPVSVPGPLLLPFSAAIARAGADAIRRIRYVRAPVNSLREVGVISDGSIVW